MDPESLESKFTKSRTNKRTENSGLAFLLADRRIQWVDTPTKRRILELIGVTGAFGTQTFDAVMTEEIHGPITVANVARGFSAIAAHRDEDNTETDPEFLAQRVLFRGDRAGV